MSPQGRHWEHHGPVRLVAHNTPGSDASKLQTTFQVQPAEGAVVFMRTSISCSQDSSQAVIIADSARLLRAWCSHGTHVRRGRFLTMVHRIKVTLELYLTARDSSRTQTPKWQAYVSCSLPLVWRKDPRFEFAAQDFAQGLYQPAALPRVRLKESSQRENQVQVLSGEGHLLWLMAHETPQIPVQCDYAQARDLHAAIGALQSRIIALDDFAAQAQDSTAEPAARS